MTKKPILTEDFKNAISLIVKENVYLPENFYQQILLKIGNLEIFPKMYPKTQTNQCRKIPIHKYIILYKIENHVVYIVNIISTKSNYYNQL